jgi:outer membrane protein assembly factor BamA
MVAVSLALIATIVSTAVESPADTTISFSESAVISCNCPEKYFSCSEFEKLHKKHLGVEWVRDLLDSLGFFNAHWDTVELGQYRVALGNRALIVEEVFSGAPPAALDSFSDERLPTYYDAAIIVKRMAELGRRMAECGYPFARISVTISPPEIAAETKGIARDGRVVSYRIEPDRKCVFASPRLVGPHSTKRAVLLHDVPVRKGDIFDIRKIEKATESLNRRSYIAAASIGAFAIEPETLRDKDDTGAVRDAHYISVPLRIKDRTGLGIEGAVGFSSRQGDDALLQGDLTLSLLNVFHRGEEASLLYAGDKTYQKFHLDASRPWLFGYPLTGSGAFGLEIHENAYGYLEGEVMVSAEIRDRWQTGVALKGSETTVDSSQRSWRYSGLDLLLSRPSPDLRRGAFATEFSFATGGGIAKRDQSYTRTHVDFFTGLHIPFFRSQAVRIRCATMHMISDEDTLVDAEMYRIGGYRTIRGYNENEFAFRTVAFDQLELLHYFSAQGSAYIFCDNGFGSAQSLTHANWGRRVEYMGYGLGIRVPARLGVLTLEWARNIHDVKSLGRVHVQVNNNNSTRLGRP